MSHLPNGPSPTSLQYAYTAWYAVLGTGLAISTVFVGSL